jgi:hypothetical protein
VVKISNSSPCIARAKSCFPHSLGLAVCIAAVVLTVDNARADILCRWFLQCLYQSPGFKIRVVDKETGKPLADVHALAVWVQYGMYGQSPGLMAQDAVSGMDGMLVFPPWGPTRGSSSGLLPTQDPVITLYKIGYELTALSTGWNNRFNMIGFGGLRKTGRALLSVHFGGTWMNEKRNS